MKFENKMDSLFYHFNKIKDKVGNRDEQIWKIAMSSIVLSDSLIRKYNGKEIAKEAVSLFPNYPDVKLMSDYILYSKENVELALEKHDKAIELYDKGDNAIALDLFKDAIELHPNKLQYYNNFIKANYRSGNFNTITEVFITMSDTFNNINPEILFYLGTSFYQESKYEIGCNILTSLRSQGLFAYDTELFPKCF